MAEMLPEATLLVNVSNDAWFGDSLAPHQHLEIARMRSIELGRDLLRANNTGITAFVDYRGRIKQTAQQFETTTLTDTVQPRTGTTPFVWWKNYAIVVLLLLSLLLAWWFGRKTNAR
jgi:apolipoprotein N-acyltransferase